MSDSRDKKNDQHRWAKFTWFVRICGLTALLFCSIIPGSSLAQVAGINWFKEEVIATIDTAKPQIYYPAIAADDYGSIHIFWTEEHAIYYIQKNEAGWTAPIDVEYSEAKSFTFPATAIDHKGMLHLVWNWLRARAGDEKGQTLTEYALILVLIAIVAIVAVTNLGQKVREIFVDITGRLHS